MNKDLQESKRVKGKPFLCKLVILTAMTYFGVFLILFLGAFIFTDKIYGIIAPYFSEGEFLKGKYLAIAGTGTLIYALAWVGLLMMNINRKAGFYLFILMVVIMIISDFFLVDFDWIRYLLNSGFAFLVGIIHFTGRCYTSRKAYHSTPASEVSGLDESSGGKS